MFVLGLRFLRLGWRWCRFLVVRFLCVISLVFFIVLIFSYVGVWILVCWFVNVWVGLVLLKLVVVVGVC